MLIEKMRTILNHLVKHLWAYFSGPALREGESSMSEKVLPEPQSGWLPAQLDPVHPSQQEWPLPNVTSGKALLYGLLKTLRQNEAVLKFMVGIFRALQRSGITLIRTAFL
jgi:hypothetical protein